MSGLLFEIHSEELEKQLNAVADRIRNKRELLRKAGAIVRASVRLNFHQGGRPAKWKKIKNRDGRPLRDTNRLMNSITSQVSGDKALVGTNVEYAPVHHFGATKGSFGEHVITVGAHDRKHHKSGKTYRVRQHTRTAKLPWGNIPARPFMLVQDEDRLDIEALTARYIVEGKA